MAVTLLPYDCRMLVAQEPSVDISSRRPGGLRRTISAYDEMADEYAERFSSVDLTADRECLMSGLPTSDGLVLDAGCGPGRDCRLFSRDGARVLGLDLSSSLLDRAGRVTSAPLAQGDVRRLPFGDQVFAGIWCCAVLLHLDPADFVRALREFHRVLMSGGVLFVTVRAGSGEELRGEELETARWFHLYSEDEVVRMALRAGFDLASSDVARGAAGGWWVNAHLRKGTS